MEVIERTVQEAIDNGDRVDSIFQMLDPQLNGLVKDGKPDHTKIAAIGIGSKSDYEYFSRRGGAREIKRACSELGMDQDVDAINFHFGFQYGFSMGSSAEHAILGLKKMLGEHEASDVNEIVIKDESIANIVIDRESGFLQLKVGKHLITCKNISTVDIIEA